MLNEKNIYNTWLNASNQSTFDKIDKKLENYKKDLDKKLTKYGTQVQDDLSEVLLADEKSKQIYYMSLVYSLPEGKKLWQEDAKKMLELWMWRFLAVNLKNFQYLDKKIAKGIIQLDSTDRACCLRNIESFVESDRAEIGEMALNYDIRAWAFINGDLDKYPWFDRKWLAQQYLSFDDDYCKKILNNFELYKWYITLDDFAIIPREIFYKAHCLEFVFDHLDDLWWDKDSFLKLIKDKYWESACDKLKKLFDLK